MWSKRTFSPDLLSLLISSRVDSLSHCQLYESHNLSATALKIRGQCRLVPNHNNSQHVHISSVTADQCKGHLRLIFYYIVPEDRLVESYLRDQVSLSLTNMPRVCPVIWWVMLWKHFPYHRRFVRRINRSSEDFPNKGSVFRNVNVLYVANINKILYWQRYSLYCETSRSSYDASVKKYAHEFRVLCFIIFLWSALDWTDTFIYIIKGFVTGDRAV